MAGFWRGLRRADWFSRTGGRSGKPIPRIRSAPPGRVLPPETQSQGFTLHPIDEDLSMGTPILGYFHCLPPGDGRRMAKAKATAGPSTRSLRRPSLRMTSLFVSLRMTCAHVDDGGVLARLAPRCLFFNMGGGFMRGLKPPPPSGSSFSAGCEAVLFKATNCNRRSFDSVAAATFAQDDKPVCVA